MFSNGSTATECGSTVGAPEPCAAAPSPEVEAGDGAAELGETIRPRNTNPAAAITMIASAATAASHLFAGRAFLAGGMVAGDENELPIQSSCLPTSRAVCQRSSGFFARHIPTTCSSACG